MLTFWYFIIYDFSLFNFFSRLQCKQTKHMMVLKRRTTLHVFHLLSLGLFLLSCYLSIKGQINVKGQETGNYGNKQTAVVAVDVQVGIYFCCDKYYKKEILNMVIFNWIMYLNSIRYYILHNLEDYGNSCEKYLK